MKTIRTGKTHGKVFVHCAQCGAQLRRFPAQVKEIKHGPFCDRHCLGAYRSKFLTKEKAANYKTGSRKSREYIEVEAHWHPGKNHKGYVTLHRLMAEAKLGRFLLPKEIVHHKDHDSRNNHWSNLEVMTQSEHAREHYKERAKEKNGQFQNTKRNNTSSS